MQDKIVTATSSTCVTQASVQALTLTHTPCARMMIAQASGAKGYHNRWILVEKRKQPYSAGQTQHTYMLYLWYIQVIVKIDGISLKLNLATMPAKDRRNAWT
jgi:hypothetical protein